MPKLKESTIRLIPYGTDRSLKLLGEARCLIKAVAGAETITTVYKIKGAQESLLGLRDAQTLGILTIRLDGNTVRMSADPPLGKETRGRQTQCKKETPHLLYITIFRLKHDDRQTTSG